MATLNLYVSDQLKERMSRRDLKWSQIASAAFEAAINIEERKEVNMEQASIERLRKSRKSVDERRYADGVKSGKEWALNKAEYDELERVADLPDQEWWQKADADKKLLFLAEAILGEEKPSSSDIDDLVEMLFDRKEPGDHELGGFVDGAREVFNQV